MDFIPRDALKMELWSRNLDNSNFDERKQEMELVSIIIPAYNTDKYIGRCIKSCISQLYKELEIIIIDDASSDNTLAIIKDYMVVDSRIRLIKHEKNLGQSAARNAGLKFASGKYILFVDSDDWIENECVLTCVKNMHDLNADILTFDARTTVDKEFCADIRISNYKRGNYLIPYVITSGRDFIIKNYLMDFFSVSVCLLFIRKSILISNNILFKEGILYEDNLFFMQCMLSALHVSYIPYSLYCRFYRNGSTMTSGLTDEKIKSTFVIVESMFNEVCNGRYCSDVEVLRFIMNRMNIIIFSVFDMQKERNDYKFDLELLDFVVDKTKKIWGYLKDIFFACDVKKSDEEYKRITNFLLRLEKIVGCSILDEIKDEVNEYGWYHLTKKVYDYLDLSNRENVIGFYGAGEVAEHIFRSLDKYNMPINSDYYFFESETPNERKMFHGKEVIGLNEMYEKNVGSIFIISSRYGAAMKKRMENYPDITVYSLEDVGYYDILRG